MSPALPVTAVDDLHLDTALVRCICKELSSGYCFAVPFPHTVIDNLLPLDLARRAQQGFPESIMPSDTVFNIGYAGQNKRQILPADCLDSPRGLFALQNLQPFLEFLERLSSMEALLPDPCLEGYGYHETTLVGKLWHPCRLPHQRKAASVSSHERHHLSQ